jgi:hypothetical protein
MISKTQLKKFVRVRNESEFSSNLQFQIDAQECGFEAKDLGDPRRVMDTRYDNHPVGYCWVTEHGVLVEYHHKLFLRDSWEEFRMSTVPSLEIEAATAK